VFVEGDGVLLFEHIGQLGLVFRHGSIFLDLEDAEGVDFGAVGEGGRRGGVGGAAVGGRRAEVRVDHLEEVGDEFRVGVELDVGRQHKVGARLFARHVPPHVHGVQQLVGALVGGLAERRSHLQCPRAVGHRQMRLSVLCGSWHLRKPNL